MTLRPAQALLLLLLIALLILTACQAEQELPLPTSMPTGTAKTSAPDTDVPTLTPTSTMVPTVTMTPTMAPLSMSGVEIDFWHPWQADLAKQADAVVADFNNTNEWGIKVRARAFYSTSAMEEAVRSGRASGTGNLPELVAASSEMISEWAAESQVVDLNAYLQDSRYGLSKEQLQGYDPRFWGQDAVGNRQNAVPALRTARVLFYNQTWAKELGFLVPPSTPEELQKQACAAAVKNNGSNELEKYGTGGLLLDTDPLTTLSWMAAFGAQIAPADEGQPYAFETPEAENALIYLREMLNKGCAWVGRSPTPQDYFASRKALFYAGWLSDLPTQKRLIDHNKTVDQWTVLAFPGLDGKPVLYAGGYSYAVLVSDLKNQAAAWLLLRWLEQPANAGKLAAALPSLPVSRAVADQLSANEKSFPWAMVLPLQADVRPAPALRTWRAVRRLLEDAAHQAYYQPADQLNQILPLLNDMTGEILKRTPGVNIP